LNPAMKQRLVGTLVLGSLALILIPLLLDGEGVERPPLSGSIPPAPVFDTTPIPEPTRPEILADTLAPAADTTEADLAAATGLTDVGTDPAAPAVADAAAGTPAADAVAAEAAAEPAVAETVATETTAEPAATEPAATETAAAPPPAAAPAQSVSAPALDPAGLPEGWAVRLGVFGSRANADRLQSRLVADGYKAYVRPLGVSTAVLVGPVLTQDEAVALQTELNGLKAKYQIDNVIVQRYDIGQ
jgi:DedD protein